MRVAAEAVRVSACADADNGGCTTLTWISCLPATTLNSLWISSRSEARSLNHGHVGTEHVLCGLLRDPGSLARQALGDLGVDVGALAERARAIVPKNALTLAVDEARRLKHKQIGTEHLLVGLLAGDDAMAHAALTEAGVTVDAARAAIQRRLARG